MTRRRALALIFGALTVVFVLASAITVVVVRDRLIDAVDEDLVSTVSVIANADVLESIEAAVGDLDIDVSQQAVLIIDGRDELAFIPAGPRRDPLPRPDLSASSVIANVGHPFQVDGVGGDVTYRVLSTELPDGRHLAVAQPLDDLRNVLRTLSQALLITLFAVVATLGTVFYLLLRASLRPYDAMVDAADAIAGGDLTRRVPAEHGDPNLDRLSDSLNSMLDQIHESFADQEAAEARLRQFVADASHELRTPLTSIRGYSELYQTHAATGPEDVTKQMTRINHEAARLGRLVDDLLRLARLDEHRPLGRDPVDLAELATEAVADERAAHPDRAIDIASSSTAAVVTGDRDALRQVLTNLLANARTHTPDGTRVSVDVAVDDEHVVCTVADDGPGMDADTAAHVFDRFFRADKARARHGGNSGLGLSITAAIVAAHDGAIRVDTRPGAGATFVVELPRSREAASV